MGNRKNLVFMLLITLVVSLTLTSLYAVSPASAAAACVVTLDGPDGDIKTNFMLGETVYIKLMGVTGNGNSVSVVFDDTGEECASWANKGDGIVGSFKPENIGDYTVKVNKGNAGVGAFVASSSFFVVPETALGSLMALSAGLAVFGLIKLKRRTD